MVMKLDVKADISSIVRNNPKLKKEILGAAARALNRTADNVRAAAVKEIAERERIKAVDVRRYVVLSVRANRTTLTARVSTSGKAPNLVEYVDKGSRTPEAWRQGEGVAAHVLGVSRVYRGTFIVRAKNGKMVVVTRAPAATRVKGKWQPKWSKGIYGPPPPRQFAQKIIIDNMDKLARVRWPINWKHELGRALK